MADPGPRTHDPSPAYHEGNLKEQKVDSRESRGIFLGSEFKKITCLANIAKKKVRINCILLGEVRPSSFIIDPV